MSRNGNIANYQIEEVRNRQGLASPRRFFYARIVFRSVQPANYQTSAKNPKFWELSMVSVRPIRNGEDVNDDERLIEQTLLGDADAFGRLVQKYQDRLFNTLVHIVGCAEEAQDVAQETFLVAFRKIGSFQGKSSLYTWLYRIAMNKWISNRRRVREKNAPADGFLGGNEPVDRSESAQNQMERTEQIAQIRNAIGDLDDQHRTILVLKDIDGLCYEEISGVLEIPIGTVRSRLHRARIQLKLKLGQVLQGNG